MKEYEIWIGYWHGGQGSHASTSPQLVATETAINFQVACVKHELKCKLEAIAHQEAQGYVDSQTLAWFYKPATNSNGWTGEYFESEAKAWESFKNLGYEIRL